MNFQMGFRFAPGGLNLQSTNAFCCCSLCFHNTTQILVAISIKPGIRVHIYTHSKCPQLRLQPEGLCFHIYPSWAGPLSPRSLHRVLRPLDRPCTHQVQCPSNTCQSIDCHQYRQFTQSGRGPYCRFNIPDVNCFMGPVDLFPVNPLSRKTAPLEQGREAHKLGTALILVKWNMAKCPAGWNLGAFHNC